MSGQFSRIAKLAIRPRGRNVWICRDSKRHIRRRDGMRGGGNNIVITPRGRWGAGSRQVRADAGFSGGPLPKSAGKCERSCGSRFEPKESAGGDHPVAEGESMRIGK